MKRKTVSLAPEAPEREMVLAALRRRGAPVLVEPDGTLRMRAADAAALRRQGRSVIF